MSTSPLPAYAAPAANGAVAYYADKAGKRFLMTAWAAGLRRVGETLPFRQDGGLGAEYRVEGFTDGVEGLTWASLGQDAPADVDGLPVARYLPRVSKPTPAQIAAQRVVPIDINSKAERARRKREDARYASFVDGRVSA